MQAGAKAWDDYSNAQEHAIEKGNAALEKYADTQKNLASATNWINENKERYVDLSQRATILGEQGDLTDSEWKEYNELSSQMAQYLPNEISGYNSLGTAMLGVAKSVEKINNALIDEKASKYREQLESAGDILGKFKAEMYQDKTDSTKESGITNQIAAAKQLISLYNEGYRSQEQLSKNSSNWLKFNKMLSDLNLTETLEKAGIEGTGFLGGLKVDDYLNEDNIESLKNYVVDLEAQQELAVDDFKQIISMSMQANKGYQKLISNSPEIDSIMSNMISGIELNDIKKILGTDDISSLSTSVMEKQLRNWSANVYSSLRRAPVQEALNELFTLDDKKATLSYSEYEKAATKAIENVRKETKVFSKQQLKDQSNISNSLDELGTAYNRISDKFKNEEGFSEDFLKNNLGTDQLIALSDIISDSSWTGSFNEALSQLQHQLDKDKYSLSSMQSVVANAQTAFSSFSTGINESMSDTGMTTESIEALKDSFARYVELDNVDDKNLNALFTNTAKGVKLNSKALEDLIRTQHKLKMSDFIKSMQQYKALSEDINKSQEERNQAELDLYNVQQAQAQYLAQYKQQMELFSQYNKWQMATQSENAGDKYNNLFSGLKQAKDLYDKGLVGTDEFKEFAALLSPSGATDADNFLENYNKAARYLTEDSSGVKNFLHDLSEKGFAKLNEQTQEWTYNIQDMAKAAQKMGMGEEFMTAMFGRLEDYGFSNNFFESIQEGQLHVNELNEKLLQGRKELALLETSGADETAITAKREEVNGLINDIMSSNETMNNLASNNAKSRTEEILNSKKAIEKLAEEYKSLDVDNNGIFATKENEIAGKNIKATIKALAADAGITLKSDLEIDTDAWEQLQQSIYGTGTVENPLSRQFEEGSEAAQNYGSVVSKIQEASAQGNETVAQSFETLLNYSQEELSGLDLFDGKYGSNALKPAEQALDNIVKTLGLSKEEATQLVNVLADMGKIQLNPSAITQDEVSNLSEVQDLLKENGTIEKKVNLTFDTSSMSNDDLLSKVEELEGLKAHIDAEVDPKASEEINALIDKCNRQYELNVKIEESGVSPEEILGGMTKEDFEAEVGVTMNDEEWESFKASVQAEQNASVSVKIDQEQFDALVKGNKNINITAKTEGKEQVDALKSSIDALYPRTLREQANVYGTKETKQLKTAIDSLYPRTLSVGANVFGTDAVNGLRSSIEALHNKTVTITTNHVSNNVKGNGSQASGTLLSPAKVSGTAYNVLNTIPYSSYASGKVSLDKDETALVNEVGVESRIRNGVWELLPGKMHMENLKKGDIILNAKQTADLLKHGKTNSFAKSYASGTAEHVRDIATPFLNSYARGTGHGGFQGGAASGGISSSTSNNSNAVNQNTHAVSQNTSQTQKNTEKIKHSTQVFDWVKTRLEYFANKTKEIADKVTDFVSFKLKESLLKSQSSSIDKEIQAQQQGYDSYMKKAQSVAEKYTYYDKDENKQTLSIPKKYQELVKNGQWNIEDMDTSTDYNKNLADAIQKYQDYIESATDCKQTIQELKNEQMELWEEIINIPIEEAESKIDRLEKKIKGLENASSTIADGGSSISRYAYQIEVDTGLKSARKKLENANKKKSDVSKKMKSNKRELKSSKNDTKNAINSLKYQAKKTENDNLVDKVYANIKNGQYVNTKGLKGEVLKAAKRYNDNLKKQREKQKQYNSSKDSYTTASKNASTAKKNYNAKKSQLSEAQQVIIDNKDKPSYLAQSALLGLQLQRKREESEIYEQTVLKTQENLKNSEAKKKASEKAREKQKSLILGNKDFTKNLSKAQLSAIKSGNLVDRTGIKDPKTLEAINKYNQLAQEARTYTEKYNVALKANEEAVANAAQSQAEYAQMALDNEKQKFENIKNHYGSQVDYLKTQLDSLQSKDDLRQEQGGEVLKSQLQRQIDKINEMQKLLKQERTKLQEQLEESVSKGVIKVNSKEWYELKEEIFDIDKQVDGLNKDVLGLQDTIRNETFYKEVNKALEKLDEVRASMETIRNLINEQALFDDDGNFTDAGITAFALDIKTYESNLESLNSLIRKRNSMIKNFNGGKNDTGYSQKEFDADMKDIESQIRDMLGNANSARKAIIDTVLSHAKAELDAVNKVIDARSELLKKQKEYYDYDKTLKGKTKDIQLLEQQIAALEGVSDAESKSKKAQLEAQLQEQQEDLQDTIFNHQYDLQIQGLDDLKTDLQENYDNYVKELNSNIDKIVDTVKNSTDNIKDCVNTVNSTIGKLLNSFGINGSLFNENVLTRSMDNESQNPYNIGIPDDNVTLHMMKMFGFSGDTNDMNEAIRNMNVPVPTLNLPDIKLPDLIPNYEAFNVQPVIECPITIMGNANENEVKRAIRQMIPEIDKEVQKSICRDLRKGGWR